MSAAPAVFVKNLHVCHAKHCVLHDVDVSCNAGELVLITGPNGGGKTTFLRVLAGLQNIQGGEVRLFGETPAAYAKSHGIGYVPQRIAAIDAGIPASVSDILESACSVHCRGGSAHSEHRAAVIADLQLQSLLHRPVTLLSGGERQKVFIARAVLSGATLLLLDEPTTGIDSASEEGLRSILSLLLSRGTTIVLVSHDAGAFADLASQVLCIDHTAVAGHDGHPPHVPHRHVHA